MNIVEEVEDFIKRHKEQKELQNEIERSREENEKLKNGSRIVTEKQSWEAFQKAMQENERLREENERLRDAAESFADSVIWHSEILVGEAEKILKEIRTEALGEKE